ncbi:MAG: cellulase family glycosylhydrolase [Cytophaga sp.]|uniref:cellulase family glycosylhydrolase n=1 Tax=Cytophaga sp. TaxID=29535 RepID=UPI003F7E89AB
MKIIYLLPVFLLCTLRVVAQQSPSLLIEDFEDGNSQNSLGGYWYSFNDNAAGGKSRLVQQNWQKEAFITTGGYQSKGMLHVDVILEKANYQWNPYYSLATGVDKTAAVNPSAYAGISYWHKGVAHKVRVQTPEVKDYDYYSMRVPASNDWTLVTIDFSMLNQEGWGKKVDLNLDNSVKLVWNLDETSGDFEIDEIRFVKEIKYEKQNNMQILPAQIPAPVAVKGNISSPLNDLSKKYLTKGMNLASWAEANKITSANPKDWKYNEAIIKLQSEQGLLGIRFPIDLDLYIEDRLKVLSGEKKKIVIEPMLYTLLDSMNNWTKRYKLSLTIDYHAYDGSYNRAASKDPKFREAVSSLWRIVAQHFVHEKREDLFFELTNEPCLSLPEGEYIDQADWTLLAQMMIDSIRRVDKTRPVIFGDTKWYSLDELIKNKPLKDKYVIYSFHMYDPFIFTHQGASWTNMGTMKGIPFPYSPERWSTEFRDFGIVDGTPDWVKDQAKRYYQEGNKQFIKNRLAQVKNWAYDNNVPLICNEWGALPNTAKIEDLNAYFKTMGEIFREMDISWQVWFGIMDSEHKLLPGMAEALDLKKK